MWVPFFSAILVALTASGYAVTIVDDLTCGPEFIACPSGAFRCIPSSWRCDGDEDCTGGTDEMDCNGVNSCPPGMTFQNCGSGCGPASCDNLPDSNPFCPAVCVADCFCPVGLIKDRNGGDQCIIPAECQDVSQDCPVTGEWFVDWDASYECLSQLTQPFPFAVPGQILPLLTVTDIIQVAGAAWTADNLIEAEGELCVRIMPQLSAAAFGADIFRQYCDPILTSLREGTTLDAEAHCRLIMNLTGIMTSYMSGPFTPQPQPTAEPTAQPYPLGISALRPFDFEGELERIVAEQYGVSINDLDSICTSRQDVVDSGLSLGELVTNFLVEFVKVLIPRGAEICNSWDEIIFALEASVTSPGNFSMGPDISVSDLLNDVSNLVAHWAGYENRDSLCQAFNDQASLDELAAGIVDNMLVVLTQSEFCSTIVQEGLDLVLAYTPTLEADTLNLQMYQFTGFHSAQGLCQAVTDAFQPRDCDLTPCLVNPCTYEECPSYPNAECRANYCGGCNADFFVDDVQVNCQDCPAGMTFDQCGSGCGPFSCDNPPRGICPRICRPGCYCPEGQVKNRDDGNRCVEFSECVPPTSCPPGTVFEECGSGCGPFSCDNLPREICPRICRPGCYCPEGLVFDHDGGTSCVTVDQCPAIIRDPCYNFICENGGYCTAPADAPYCVCTEGFTGDRCQLVIPTTEPTDGSVRLADGWTEFEGRVEVFYNSSWFTVCDYAWSIEEADVVCRQLGFDAAIAATCCSRYGYTDLPSLFGIVECTGSEENLLSCQHSEPGFGDCYSFNHAGVACRRALTPCPLPSGPTIDWDAIYECEQPYYLEFHSEFRDIPQVPGEVMPFLTVGNIIDTTGAIWISENMVEGMGQFCRLMAPRLTVVTQPEVFRGLCDPVLTALSDGTDVDSEQICRFIYSIATPRPYTEAPYTPETDAPYTPGTETPYTPVGLSTGYPSFNLSVTPIICIFPFSVTPAMYPPFTHGPLFGIDALRNFDIVTLLNQVVESVLNITSYDEDSVCPAVGHLTNSDYSPRAIATDFMAEFLAGLFPRTAEICESWDEVVEAILNSQTDISSEVDIGIVLEELPAIVSYLADFPDRESLCLYIQTATIIGGDAIDTSAKFMVQNMLNVVTNQEKCISLLNSIIGFLARIIDGVTVDSVESIYLPLYTGFHDVQQICQYTASSFSPRNPVLAVRLADGETPAEGRVEVQYEGEWGTVCDDAFDDDDATVVCRALGYRGASLSLGNINPGTGEILLDDVNCTGVESNIGQCPNAGIAVDNCNHVEDVSVSCSLEVIPPTLPTEQPTTTTTNMGGFVLTRLVGGRTENEGRLEVFYQGQWGTVCDDGWSSENTDVACRSLNFEGGESYSCCAEYGQGVGNIILDDVTCTGDEYNIASCRHRPPLDHNCRHSEDVGITCTPLSICEGDLVFQTCGSACPLTCDDPEPRICTLQCVQECQCPYGLYLIPGEIPRCVPREECPSQTAVVRLVGGSNEAEGRVEVLADGVWGTVCDDGWDLNDANVVCRMLGYQGASEAPQRARFGQGSGDILLDDVVCSGSEDSLFDCEHSGIGVHNCAHSEDASVICNDAVLIGLRLVGGSNDAEGRVEIQDNDGDWGTVCDDGWDLNDANVVCRMLGYQGASEAPQRARFGQGSGDILLDDVVCSGSEDSLFDCEHSGIGVHNCVHSEDASVICNEAALIGLRLVGGSNDAEGRVEIQDNDGDWGTVCDDGWDLNDANVVCRMLGYQGASEAPQRARFGQGSGDILLDDVVCSGSEDSLFDCEHSGIGVHNCAHSEDASVICNEAALIGLRLVGGSNDAEGRVEIQDNDGDWGTVCDDGWDLNDANVVCRMLGYQGASEAPQRARFGQGSGDILLDDVVCSGSEDSLFDCEHSGIGVHNCAHSEDASVICNVAVQIGLRLVGGSNDAEGRVEIQDNDGDWGTVCDDGWDLNDANVVCRMLGYQGASEAPQRARFGQGSGDILLDDVVCSGSEDSLFDCEHSGIGVHNCAHSEDASVICNEAALIGLRLVGGSNDAEGRVEIQDNDGDWGTVCDDGWDLNDANVVCRMLGYQGASEAPQRARFGQGSGDILLDDVVCSGSEDSLFDCEHSGIGVHNCAHSEDASVICNEAALIGLRLVGGSNDAEGRVEIQDNDGDWGTVCDDGWDLNDANVVCRMLGYQGASEAPQRARFGQGSGDILLDDVVCSGSEDSLFDCQHRGIGVHNCAHSEDASVICNESIVRLVGGRNAAEGTVEIQHEGEWGTVCDDFWDLVDANVVCRMLGFQGAYSAQRNARFGQGSGDILLDDVSCTGDEDSLFDCGHSGIRVHNCSHYEDAGVVCVPTDN